jgi:deoxyadenosine/deoxycytidine kinase
MKRILITGLDGSGKSTLLERLKTTSSSQHAFLHVPNFDLLAIPDNFSKRQLCLSINEMGKQADELKVPLLKIYALFGSMSIVSLLEKEFENLGKLTVFYERHPLIDAPIYALSYKSFMDPSKFDESTFALIDKQFGQTLIELLELIHLPYSIEQSPSKSLLQFIHHVFGKAFPTLEELKTIFSCELPDKIYFLDASPSILLSRLSDRKQKEHHEEISALTHMREHYLSYLRKVENVTIIDANDFENLNQFSVDD